MPPSLVTLSRGAATAPSGLACGYAAAGSRIIRSRLTEQAGSGACEVRAGRTAILADIGLDCSHRLVSTGLLPAP